MGYWISRRARDKHLSIFTTDRRIGSSSSSVYIICGIGVLKA